MPPPPVQPEDAISVVEPAANPAEQTAHTIVEEQEDVPPTHVPGDEFPSPSESREAVGVPPQSGTS